MSTHPKLHPDSMQPGDLAADATLSRGERIRILREWKLDEIERLVAEEENMGGGAPSRLGEVEAALAELGAAASSPTPTPTKHGSI